jgi:hypothetical protein
MENLLNEETDSDEDSFETVIDHELLEYDDIEDRYDNDTPTIKIVSGLFATLQLSLDTINDDPENNIRKIKDEYMNIINDYNYIIKNDIILQAISSRLKLNIGEYEKIHIEQENIKKLEAISEKGPINSQKYYYIRNQLDNISREINLACTDSELDIVLKKLNLIKNIYFQIISQYDDLIDLLDVIKINFMERREKILNKIDVKSCSTEEYNVVQDKLTYIMTELQNLQVICRDEIITKICDDFYTIQNTFADIIFENSNLVLIESKIKQYIAEYYDRLSKNI